MGRKLLIVASKRYGDYVKEIAESMGSALRQSPL